MQINFLMRIFYLMEIITLSEFAVCSLEIVHFHNCMKIKISERTLHCMAGHLMFKCCCAYLDGCPKIDFCEIRKFNSEKKKTES